MDINGIVIALIGVFGALLVGVISLVLDLKKSNSIKNDTVDIKPRIGRIEEDGKRTVDLMLQDVKPGVLHIKENTSDVATNVRLLVEELNYQKRLKSEFSGDKGYQNDRTIHYINSIFEENAKLSNQLKEKQLELNQARDKIIFLQEKCSEFENENFNLIKKINEFERIDDLEQEY